MASSLHPNRALMRKIVTAASNPRATEAHHGVVQSSTVVTLTNGVKKCWVNVDGSPTAQLCRYNANVTPTAGHHYLVLNIGGDNRLRQHYVVAFELAGTLVTASTYDTLLASYSPSVWWKLADASGSTSAADSSGNGYTGTKQDVGTITFGESGSPISGNTCALFATAYIQNTSVPAIGTAAWTLLGWGSASAVTSRADIISVGTSSTGAGAYLYVSSGVLHCDLSSVVGASGGTVAVNTWYFFAVTYSAGTMTLYLNGSSVGTKGSLSPNLAAGAYGGAQPTDTDEWPGYLAELAVISGTALTGAQISSLYSAA